MRLRVVFTIVVALCAAPSAHALTKPQADAAALKALSPQAQGGHVVVFGLPKALGKKHWVVEAAPARHPAKATSTLVPKPLRRKAWLYWEDLSYGAYFAHPSVLLLIDDATGKVLRKTSYRWWPLVDGKAPAFATTGYVAQAGAVYSTVKRAAALAWSPHATFDPPVQVPKGAFDGDCILIVGTPHDLIFVNDLNAVIAEGKRLGITVYAASHSGSVRDPANGADVGRAMTRLVEDEHCKDVLVYFHAHSYAPPGPVAMHVDTVVKRVNGRVVEERRDITPDDLQKALRANAKATFKFVFDTCFAQNFTDALGDEKNLLISLASSSGSEESWWFHPSTVVDGTTVTNATDNPGVTDFRKGRSEFLNGLLGGVESVVTDAAQSQAVAGEGGSFLAHLLDHAFDRERDNDFASQTGNTHPARVFLRPPAVTPLGAVFVQADFATYYGVVASDPDGRELNYAWSLKPPANDPHCDDFASVTGEPTRAVWRHGDQNGCNHALEGPEGHLGTVTLVVDDGVFSCALAYFGTETGTGKPALCVRNS